MMKKLPFGPTLFDPTTKSSPQYRVVAVVTTPPPPKGPELTLEELREKVESALMFTSFPTYGIRIPPSRVVDVRETLTGPEALVYLENKLETRTFEKFRDECTRELGKTVKIFYDSVPP